MMLNKKEPEVFTYEEAAAYIEEIPKFTKKHTLEHTKLFLKRLGNPAVDRKIVHVAGTNGKGSVCAYLQAILMAEGKRTGFFTSPHLVSVNERIRMDNVQIDNKTFLEVFRKVLKTVRRMVEDGIEHPSYFEFLFGMGMTAFAETDVEYIILETGLGGRLDATNVVKKPIATVIASIGMDHMQFLGDTLEKIASEKAGIIKEGCPVISYDNTKEVNEVIKNKAKQMHAKVTFVNSAGIRVLQESLNGESFSYRSSDGRWYEKIEIPLLGRHQINNAALALETLNVIKNYYCISDFQTEDGMRKTIWRGRIEILEREPMVICDGAHNPDGAKSLLSFLQNNFTNQRLIYIMGVLSDKDYEQMVQILAPAADKIYTVAPDNPRALSSRELCNCISKYHQNVEERQRLAECLSEVRQKAEKDDVIIICGTLSFQNELINQ